MKPSQQALDAVRAAKNRKQWGQYTTSLFVSNRGINKMYLIALAYESQQ